MIFRRLAAAIAAGAVCLTASAQLYKNPKVPLEDRVRDLFAQLQPDEKLLLLSGNGSSTAPIARLGIPPMPFAVADAQARANAGESPSPTVFPSGVALGATWDRDLVERIGRAMAEEARNLGEGARIVPGPSVNIHRSPLGPRNGDSFSEDPYLSGQLAISFIHGVQEAGAAANLREYACQSPGTDAADVRVGERALREIYLPAFEAGVKQGGAWTLLTAPNKVNGSQAGANSYLLVDVLKKGWGFDGLVVLSPRSAQEAASFQAGSDFDLAGNENSSAPKLQEALSQKSLAQETLDESVRRVLRTILRTGLLDGPAKPDAELVNFPAHKALAREAAAKSLVLLKNDASLLPLDRKSLESLLVVTESPRGTQADARALNIPALVAALQKQAGKNVPVRALTQRTGGVPIPISVLIATGRKVTHGFRTEYFSNLQLEGEPALTRVEHTAQISKTPAGIPSRKFSARWSATLTAPASGTFALAFTGNGGFRVRLDGRTIIDAWKSASTRTVRTTADLEKGKTYALGVECFFDTDTPAGELTWTDPSAPAFAEVVEAAKKSSVTIVAVSSAQEQPSMELPGDQSALLRAVAAAGKPVIAILATDRPVSMNGWLAQVPAVLEAWEPGPEGGTALAAALFGETNPSGRLPDTFGANRADYPDRAPAAGQAAVDYSEGIYVGYRHFDKQGIAPLFPFGHGLSYTTFAYKNLKLSQSGTPIGSSILVSVDITNTGARAGDEVVQLYVRDPQPKIDRPVRELKGFDRVSLQPGESGTVAFTITPRDFAYFDVPGAQWKAPAGSYDIEIGASSRDIRLKTSLVLDADFTEKVPSSRETLPR